MTEERLKEIKDSIELQEKIANAYNCGEVVIVLNEERELYNELVSLRKIINDAIKLCEEDAEAIWEYEGAYSYMFELIKDVLQGKEKEDDK